MPRQKYPKYIFITGGVISGLGKGIITSSTAHLLQSLGFKVSVIKADMYLNLDAGTMNPLEHGEVFVTEDGLETDQDLGHYERFMNQNILKHNYMTMGQIYYDVITRDRELGYGGKCVEGHIHVPFEIIRRLEETAEKDDAEIVLIEVGGTAGEYQNVMFFEAIRRMKQKFPQNVFLMHLVYLVIPGFLGEMKSKPAQTSIYELYKLGLHPDFIVCRSDKKVDEKRKSTIAFNTGVKQENIISAEDVDTIYNVPKLLHEQDFEDKLLEEMDIKPKKKLSTKWFDLMDNVKNIEKAPKKVKIGITGKYFKSDKFSLEDAYVCVIEAIKHAAWKNNLKPEIKWFDVERMEKKREREKMEKELMECDGLIVPQGWGSRGVEGKLKVVEFARVNKIPYLGLCFGMQMAVIEFARNVLGLKDANSEEVTKRTKNPVIHIMEHQKKLLREKKYGGTIRLGAWPCKLNKKSILCDVYSKNTPSRMEDGGVVMERHRHRYEFNNKYKKKMEKAGLIISGTSPDGIIVESIELPKDVHPFFVGTQFHPEYKSRPLDPHPIFVEFLKVCKKRK